MRRCCRRLCELCVSRGRPLRHHCERLHRSLRHIIHRGVRKGDLRAASLTTHVGCMTARCKLSLGRRGRLRAFHLASGSVLGRHGSPMGRRFLHSLHTITCTCEGVFTRSVPLGLFSILPGRRVTSSKGGRGVRCVHHVHMYFSCTSSACLCMRPMSMATSRPVQIICGGPNVGRRFRRAVGRL